jgi:hypothetical protein
MGSRGSAQPGGFKPGGEGRRGGGVELVQLGADLVGGRRVKAVQELPCPPPGLAGSVGIAGGVVAGAQLGEGAGLAVAVADLAEQLQG